MDTKRVCFISRGTPHKGLESFLRREYLLYEYFDKVFKRPIFLDVSKVFTSKVLSAGELTSSAHALLPQNFEIIVPKDLKEFRRFLRTGDLIAVSNFSEEWYDWYIHYYLKKYLVPLIYIHTMSEIIDFQYQKGENKGIAQIWARSKRVCFKIIDHLLEYIFCAKVDTLFISNKRLAGQIKNSRRFKEVVITNSRFYDSYLAHSYPVTEDYIVFLDSMLPYHLDQVNFGHRLIDRELYYFNLDRVLNTVEQKLGKKAVVCLHPKYDEKNLEKDFGRRQTVKHRTQEFTARAAVVLFHESSAINNAVLYNKKVVQLAGSGFNEFIRTNCESVRKALGVEALDMYEATEQQVDHLLGALKVNTQRYTAFLSDYIVSPGKEGVASCRQIADHIKLKYM